MRRPNIRSMPPRSPWRCLSISWDFLRFALFGMTGRMRRLSGALDAGGLAGRRIEGQIEGQKPAVFAAQGVDLGVAPALGAADGRRKSPLFRPPRVGRRNAKISKPPRQSFKTLNQLKINEFWSPDVSHTVFSRPNPAGFNIRSGAHAGVPLNTRANWQRSERTLHVAAGSRRWDSLDNMGTI